MKMDDDLESFLEEHRAKVAKEKAFLEQDPPYMEIRTRRSDAYDSARKENVPPTQAPRRSRFNHTTEEGGALSLPLGEEYERKKQRLQQELRMDYRRYMAQVQDSGMTSKCPPESRDVRFSPRPPALPAKRDEGPLMVAESEAHKGRGQWAEAERDHGGRFRDVGVECNSDSDCSSEEMALLDWDQDSRRRAKHSQVLRNFEKQQHQHNYTAERSQSVIPIQPRQLSRVSVDDRAELSTGLMIGPGQAVSAEQRRRKERYRQELEEQIAQQQSNRRREKDMELRVAATGATDPEKRPDRIPQYWAGGGGAVPQRPCSSVGGDASRPRSAGGHLLERQGPHRALASPLLAALEAVGGDGLPPAHREFSQGHSSSQRDVSPPRSQIAEPYFCSGAWKGRQASTALWAEPDLGPRARPRDVGQPASRTCRVNRPLPGIEDNPPRTKSMLSYQEALKQQILERQERRRRQVEEEERYEARLRAEMNVYAPWGRAGGGAPLRDNQGNLIADLNQMHKFNEEAYLHPEAQKHRGAAHVDRNWGRISSNIRDSAGCMMAEGPQVAPGTPFADTTAPQLLHKQDDYKDYLRRQIEEKRRREAEERERLRMEEEREERRLEEQRAQIRREYEEEQEKRTRKEMELKAKNEELIRQAEQRRKEEQRRREERANKENDILRKQYERERQARLEAVPREPSPPIPTLQKRHGHQFRPRPPSADQRQPAVLVTEHCVSGSQSPPVPARRNQLRAAEEKRGILDELSALRRQLRSEQRRLEEQLLRSDLGELDTPLSVRCRDRPLVDVFDMARLRLQVPVRRPSSKATEPVSTENSPNLCQSRNRSGVDLLALTQQAHSSRTSSTDQSVRSLPLESESAFLGPGGQVVLVPPDTNVTSRQLTARERRRLARRTDLLNETSSRGTRRPAGRADGPRTRSEASSVEMVVAETWTRPGTTGTLNSVVTVQNKGRSPSRKTLGPDWEGPSTYHG